MYELRFFICGQFACMNATLMPFCNMLGFQEEVADPHDTRSDCLPFGSTVDRENTAPHDECSASLGLISLK